MLTAMRDDERTKALAELRQPRPCRVCGLVFTPKRWDKVLCSTTCQQRYHRGGDLAYIDRFTTEVARGAARRRHERIQELIESLQDYTAAERECLRHRRAAGAFGQPFGRAAIAVIEHLAFMRGWQRDPPAITTPEMVMEAINQVIPNCSEEFAAQLQAFILDTLGSQLRAGDRSTVIADRSGTTGAASALMMVDPAVPFRPLSPEATAVLEKIFQTWRVEVVRALNEAVQAGMRPIQAAISKALPHIPPEAIAAILKEL
jgi:hypothetical protein